MISLLKLKLKLIMILMKTTIMSQHLLQVISKLKILHCLPIQVKKKHKLSSNMKPKSLICKHFSFTKDTNY